MSERRAPFEVGVVLPNYGPRASVDGVLRVAELADNGTVYEYRVSEMFAVSPDDTWVTDPIPGRDVISLQTCTETPDDWWTIGPGLFEAGPESGRLIVRADRVA